MHMLQSTKLIEGVYTPQEAKEILMDLLDHEINFYKIQNLSAEVRQGNPDAQAWNKVQELSAEKERVLQMIRSAAEEGKKVNIYSTVHLRLEN